MNHDHVVREVITFDSCAIRHFGLFRFNSDWTRQFFYQDFWRFILPICTPLTTMMSQCRQNYHEECEAGINKQINLELYASYVYLSMVSFVMTHSSISVGEHELNAIYSCLKGLSLRSWWCGVGRIPQVHAETVGWRTRTRSKGKENITRLHAYSGLFASPSCFHPCPNLSLFDILADEIPESAWRAHCVGRHQG